MNPKLLLTVAFLMSRSIGVFQADVQCPTVENSIGGMFLRGHTFKSGKVGCPGECFLMCEEEVTCQSYNFVIGHKVCELNNRTKEARPEDFIPDQMRFYMKRAKKRAPLGSIKELPAETCSEIKASEGNDMVNGDYWLYSDGNAQTILARCEENWQKINTDPVCFKARGDQYGAFNITKSGLLKTMKLVHKNGSIRCNSIDKASYWGCRYDAYKDSGLMTIITNRNKEAILPSAEELKNPNGSGCNKTLAYSLNGTNHTSPELIFRKNVSVSYNQEMQIWYGQDWIDCSEFDNTGKTCVDVYAWYA